MSLARIDANRFERLSWKIMQGGDSELGIMLGVFGGILSVVSFIMGFAVGFSEGGPLVGTLMVMLPLLFIWLYIAMIRADNRILIRGGWHGATTDWDWQITKAYNSLNEDNKAIAYPLVLKVYKQKPQKAANGDYLYADSCQQAVNVVKLLLEEQIATEKALAEAETRLQKANRDASSEDVQHVLDYVKAQQQTRKEFVQKQLEIT